MIDIEKFKKDVISAQEAADMYRHVDDGGTCNFDTVYVFLGRKSKRLTEALSTLDIKVEPMQMRGYSGFWWAWFNTSGQADRRTMMAEAANKRLRELGWESHVYYMMD